MLITKVTLDWYRQRTCPQWAKGVIAKEHRISIDAVINSQAGNPDRQRDYNFSAHNLMGLCKAYIRRGELIEQLRIISLEPGTVIQPQRRAAFAKKWLNRILKNRRAAARQAKVAAKAKKAELKARES